MIVRVFYYDPCILPNSVIADTDEGLFLFREGGIVRLTEMPPSSLELGLKKKRCFFHKNSKGHPQRDHLSNLNSIYTSELDTIFFFENGASILLLHRNFYTQGLHYASSPMPEPAPVFFSASEAEELGILEKDISANPFYSKVDYGSQSFAEPVESAYIVYPGWLLQNESYLFSNISLRNDILSVDFVMNNLDAERNPIQLNQFWQVPSLFCSITHAVFDHNIWNSRAKENYLTGDNTYMFSIHDKCIAEIICVDTFCEISYFPYHDTFTLTLNYLKAFDSEVKKMIHLLLDRYDNIIPVPPHLCGRDV